MGVPVRVRVARMRWRVRACTALGKRSAAARRSLDRTPVTGSGASSCARAQMAAAVALGLAVGSDCTAIAL
eukprot:103072-Pleurochrysis_carterae.AAC.2